MHNLIDSYAEPLWSRFRDLTRPLWGPLLTRGFLSSKERMVLSGSLFAGCAEFVCSVVDGMAFDDELFEDLPVAAGPLHDRQERALALLSLSYGLQDLGQLAYDEYLREQSEAVKDAMAVVQRVRLDATRPLLSLKERVQIMRRLVQLGPAQKLLSDRQRRKQHKKQQKKARALP